MDQLPDFYPIVRPYAPRHGIDYYIRRFKQGVEAHRHGIRNTPLTKMIELWSDQPNIIMVRDFQVPGAWEAYLKVWLCYENAIDAEDDLAPYRFQKTGRQWSVHFQVRGVVKNAFMDDSVGNRYLSQCLAKPDRNIESAQLSGIDPTQLLSDQSFQADKTNDALALSDYEKCLDHLNEKRESAKLSGDIDEMDKLDDQINQLVTVLRPGIHPDQERNLKGIMRQQVGPPSNLVKNHKAVALAIKRAIGKLRDNDMSECARYLTNTVRSEGYGFAYRPHDPVPQWLI